ncbi:MAG: putative PEP-binding protein [bacterium]
MGQHYLIGTMVETPAAAVNAFEIGKIADFISFGTNDLTQYGIALDRDACGEMIVKYLAKHILQTDPTQTIDPYIAELVFLGAILGKSANSKLKVGVCGEHGGDIASADMFVQAGLDYVSCNPPSILAAKLVSAQRRIRDAQADKKTGISFDIRPLNSNDPPINHIDPCMTEEGMEAEQLLGYVISHKEEYRKALTDKLVQKYTESLRKDNNAFIRLFNSDFGSILKGLTESQINELVKETGARKEKINETINRLSTPNSALGTRGARQFITGDSVYTVFIELQVKALFKAMQGDAQFHPRIIIPFLIDHKELSIVIHKIYSLAESLSISREKFSLGACIETPRAALSAGNITKTDGVAFIVFDTLGLTEHVLGLTRNNLPDIIDVWLKNNIYQNDPFNVFSNNTTGRFVALAVRRILMVKKDIPMFFFGHDNLELDNIPAKPIPAENRTGASSALLTAK